MKKLLIFIIIIVGFIAVYNLNTDKSRLRENNDDFSNQTFQNPNSVIQYISQNIATLSPEKATMGGNFYVTNITLDSGSGVVEYEDGHSAYTARFDYSYVDDENVKIENFALVE